MQVIYKEVSLFKRKVPVVAIVWFALALIAVTAELLHGTVNNYLIFKQVFWHVTEQKHLYLQYPAEYEDANHYGPLFSILIAPFAVLPVWLGCSLWALANAAFLFWAIMKLKIERKHKLIIVAITAVEMMTAIHNVQFNAMLAGWLILTYVWVEEEKDFWATLLIAAGFLIKLYGVVGLLFFVFSRHKLRFILYFLFWMIALFCLPMLISSPQFILNSYQHWYESLVAKNIQNVEGATYAGYQDISVMGMIRRISQNPYFPNLAVMAPAAICILVPLLRFKQYKMPWFRLSYLAIVLISVVIFSSSAESATYVIAVPGAAAWYIMHKNDHPAWSNVLLVLLFVLTIFSATDLVPSYLKDHFIRAYSLKALPCLLIWVWLIKDVAFKHFTTTKAAEIG